MMNWSSIQISGHLFSENESYMVFRFRVLNYFMFIGVVFGFLVGLLGHLGVMKIGTIQPVANYIFATLNLFTIYYLRKDKAHYSQVAWTLVISTFALFTVATVTVSGDEARIVWFYITVYISYMLLGVGAGIVMSITCLLTVIIANQLTDLEISETALFTFILALVSLSLLARAHAIYIGRYEARMRETNRRLDKNINEMDAALMTERQSNKVKTLFLANISHEIRTPMNGLLSMAQVMKTTDLDEQQQDYLGAMERSGQSLLALIDDLLDLSRIEAGAFELKPAPFEVWSWVEDLLNQLEPLFENSDVHFLTDISDDLPQWLNGDKVRLQQVIVNLVSNAAKFTPEGEVQLLLHGGLKKNKFRLHIEVIDTGVGIQEDKLDAIFNNFHQLSPDRIANKGVGLGLPICKNIIELMDGSIEVFSVPGEGSRFVVNLNLGLAEAPVTEQKIEGATTTLRPLSILLVEDDRISRLAVESLFRSQGHKVTVTDDGEKAIQQLMKREFDVILMDIHMPVMDGLEATRHIKTHELTTAPIIGMTASVMNTEKDAYFDAGLDALIDKPIDFELLMNVIRSSIKH